MQDIYKELGRITEILDLHTDILEKITKWDKQNVKSYKRKSNGLDMVLLINGFLCDYMPIVSIAGGGIKWITSTV